MADEAGEENFFLFGLTADQVASSRGYYSPRWHYKNESETRAALDLIFNDHFSCGEPGVFNAIRDTLLDHGDHYMHLADLTSYAQAQQRLGELYTTPDAWGAEGDSEHCQFREVFQRPNDRRVCRGELERTTLSD